MHDWILGLQKAATTYGPGASEEALGAVEAEAGEALPAGLRSLYLGMDGAVFPSDVTLYPLRAREGTPGLLEQVRSPADALPRRGIWPFGRRGFGEHLFASRRRELVESGAELPGWFDTLPDGVWVFGLMSADTGELSLFRTLEHLLWTLIPPAETEEFGENTFARALSVVETAMSALERPDTKPPTSKTPSRRIRPAAKKGSQRKQARPAPRKAKGTKAATGAKKAKAAKRGAASRKPRRSTRASKPPRRRR